MAAIARTNLTVRAYVVGAAIGKIHAALVSRGQVDAYIGDLFENVALALVPSADGDDDIAF